jgi:hypothetical protein
LFHKCKIHDIVLIFWDSTFVFTAILKCLQKTFHFFADLLNKNYVWSKLSTEWEKILQHQLIRAHTSFSYFGWIDEIEKGIYQIAYGLKSLFLVQLSQKQNIFRFDKCLSVALYSWRFRILDGNLPKIWKMKINILFTLWKSFFAINRSKTD